MQRSGSPGSTRGVEGLAQMAQSERFDVVVVGSGFGGAVAAYRLAAAGQRVCLLERGKAYPPGSFPRTPRDMARNFWDPSEGRHGMFNVWSFRGLEAVVSSGLGGGSLIYANVLLRKDERWFVHEQPFDGGYEHWPIGRADLLGLEWQLPKLAVTFANPGAPPAEGEPIPPGEYPNLHGRTRVTCRMCGECDLGCNFGAKNTLDHTYLSAARHQGAELRTRCEVRRFAPLPSGGYRVCYVRHDPDREGQPTRTAELPEMVIDADRLVLAAGTFGTTYLLLRSLDAFPALSRRALGTRFSGNGDLLTFLVGHGDGTSRVVDGSRGPVITSAIRVPDESDGGSGRGYYVEDAGYPGFVDWMIEAAGGPRGARRLLRFALRRLWARLSHDPRSDLSAELAALLGSGALSSSSLPLLGMGRDVPDGVMRLAKGYLDVDWTVATSAAYFDRVRSTMREIAGELGASFRDNPLWWRKRVITVHPLGGCPMGRHQGEGVVNADGEAFGYPGLFVCDGSVMPGPVGANPSLTIAAFADRMAERIAERHPAGRRVLT